MPGRSGDAKRILVADDDEDNRGILKRRLSRLGFDVQTVESGQAALQAIATDVFDAVLLDSLMPDLSGIDVLKTMRERNDSTRVIMVSGKALLEDFEQARALGADGYVTKPVDFTKLVNLIKA